MFNFFISIIGGSIFLIALVAVVMYRRSQKIVKARERDIVHHIRIQDLLKKEIHSINVEKNALEKLLKSKFDIILTAKKKDK
jgi:amino acid permease